MTTISKDAAQIEREKALAKKALRRELALEMGDRKERPLSPLAQKKKALRKKRLKQAVILFFIALIGYGIWFLFKPFKQGMNYGICKVFAELQVPYPYTIYYSEVIEFSDSVRIWFSYLDSFGDYRLVPIQCYFAPHERYGFGVSQVTIGRREIDPDVVERFNASIPAIVSNPPDLIYPTPLPNDPADLQFDFDRFRKQIL
ncbi:MAG: hypothetical protein ACLFR0_05585 [Alphaproteobacteria bacterium]